MLELPEVLTVAEQLKNGIVGKKVVRVLPPSKEHKFCWYNGDPAEYDTAIRESEIVSVEGFGIFVEMSFSNGYKLCFNDGVNVRLESWEEMMRNYQLLIEFNDDTKLVFSVTMYGGIFLHNGSYDNEYYLKSKYAISPFSPEFKEHYYKIFMESKPNLSGKAFLATEQRFPGIGNGVTQDILFAAGIHPKRKINTFSESDKKLLLNCIITVLKDMIENGGRDKEKDIFGKNGGYKVRMSKDTIKSGCPKCGGQIIKESYLGGSAYYCPFCQPLIKE
jgi:formamidopyrimidine-DNA glycosylase